MAVEHPIVLLTGSANVRLAEAVGSTLELDAVRPTSRFSDGEIRVSPVATREADVYIIQPTSAPVNDHLMELLLIADAARRADAHKITAVIPYFGYARQDRLEQPGVPVSSAVAASMLEVAGVNRIVTMDIHSEQQQGFFHGPWHNLYGSRYLIPQIATLGLKPLVIASPDKGGANRAVAYATRLNADGVALVYKDRGIATNNHSKALAMIGDVANRDVVIVDDMIDTAGTMVNASALLLDRGARSVRLAATHGLFSGEALERISNSEIVGVFVTDTIRQPPIVVAHSKVRIVSISPLLAEAIQRLHEGKPLSFQHDRIF